MIFADLYCTLIYINSLLILIRSLKDLGSDRGAETYDFTIITEERAKERQRQREAMKGNKKLDKEIDSYWGGGGEGGGGGDTMEDGAGEEEEEENAGGDNAMEGEEKEEEKRGTKRSAKERLGNKRIRMDR